MMGYVAVAIEDGQIGLSGDAMRSLVATRRTGICNGRQVLALPKMCLL